MNLQIKKTSMQELREILFDKQKHEWRIPTFRKSSSVYDLFKGFCFFKPNHLFDEKNPDFISAYSLNEVFPKNLVGVIKTGKSNCFGKLPEYTSINYIDVREDARCNGVATQLIKSLNSFFTPKDVLVGTPLEEMGKACKLDQKLHSFVTICPYFDINNEYAKYLKENQNKGN
ncbi:MAG: hypothetical protein ACP5OG_04090 [Candidatus Nanoarchaeia archaeon]